MGHPLTGEQALEERERLEHAVDPDPRPVVLHPELTVVRNVPAGADAQLQASA